MRIACQKFCAYLSSRGAWLVLRVCNAQNSSDLTCRHCLCASRTHALLELANPIAHCTSQWVPGGYFWVLPFSGLPNVLSFFSLFLPTLMLIPLNSCSCLCCAQSIFIFCFMGLRGHLVWLCIGGLCFCYIASGIQVGFQKIYHCHNYATNFPESTRTLVNV